MIVTATTSVPAIEPGYIIAILVGNGRDKTMFCLGRVAMQFLRFAPGGAIVARQGEHYIVGEGIAGALFQEMGQQE